MAAHAAELQSCRVARHGGLLRHRGVELGPQCWLLLLQVAVVVQVERDVLVRKGHLWACVAAVHSCRRR